jgi:hypothetical protein
LLPPADKLPESVPQVILSPTLEPTTIYPDPMDLDLSADFGVEAYGTEKHNLHSW